MLQSLWYICAQLQGNKYKIFPFRRPVSQMGEYLYFSNSYKLNVASGFLVIYNIYTFVNLYAIGTQKLSVASPKNMCNL